jgi:hypothetical protein
MARDAVVTIPVYSPNLTETQQLSLSRCASVLGRHPTVFFGPVSLDFRHYTRTAPAASVVRFDDRFFASLEAYSELLLSREFYWTFSDYEFLLIHQLDAFVFRDDLHEWCTRAYDYVGAPWLDDTLGWLGVGNGGFSLRKVSSFLRVLESTAREDACAYWRFVRLTTPNRLKRALKAYRLLPRVLGAGDNVKSFLHRFVCDARPEDLFWGLHAVRFDRSFCVAPIDVAYRFAVEGGLKEVYQHYADSPPFGCHRERFITMIRHYLKGDVEPADECERLVWDLAKKAGMTPGSATSPLGRGATGATFE